MSATIGKINSHGEHVSVFKIMDGSKRIVDIRQNLEKDKLRKLKYIEKDPGKFVRLKSIRGNEKGFSFEGIRNISIPDEYQEVEYLESVSTNQYIDTKYYPIQSKLSFELKVAYTSNTTSSKGFGCRNAAKAETTDNCSFMIIDGKFRNDWNLNSTTYNSTAIVNKFYNIKGTPNEFIIDTDLVIRNIINRTYNKRHNYSMYLFAINTGGTASINNVGQRIKKCIIYEDTEIVRNYTPCYRKSDNKPGMYDAVTGEFYTNAGTGEFVTGPEVEETSFILPVSLKNFISNSFSETDGKIIGNRSCYSEVIFDKKKITCIQRWGKDSSGKYIKLSMPVTTIFNLDDILDVSLPLDNENISLTNGEDDIFAIMDIYKSVYREAKIEYINLTDEENTLTDKDGNEFTVGYITRN